MTEDEVPSTPTPQAIAPPPSLRQQALESSQGATEGLQFLLDSGTLGNLAGQQVDIQRQQAPRLAQLNVDVQRQFTPQLLDIALQGIKSADPTGFQLREQLGTQIANELALGGSLSDAERRSAQQNIRAAQTSRGMGTGLSDAIDETAFIGGQEFNRASARRGAAQQFLSGRTPLDQIGQIPGSPVQSPDVSGFAASLAPNAGQLLSTGANDRAQMASNINQANQLAFQQSAWQHENTTNPFLTGLSTAGTIAGSIAGATMGNPFALGSLGNVGQPQSVGGTSNIRQAQPVFGLPGF